MTARTVEIQLAWCSAWGICQLAEEPDETVSSGGGMEVQSGDMEEEIDHIMLELSQQLQSSLNC